jgi:hypothetical protein
VIQTKCTIVNRLDLSGEDSVLTIEQSGPELVFILNNESIAFDASIPCGAKAIEIIEAWLTKAKQEGKL